MRSAGACTLRGWVGRPSELMYYDLHIHSALSPCAEDEMTPGNVCAMARLKGLELIAVTDHNSAGNLRAFERASRERGLMLLPGIEICTSEEVHLLAYFPRVEQAERMGAWCKEQLKGQKNRPDYFGPQLLMDHQDQVTGEEEALLIGALAADLSQVCRRVEAGGGVTVPAHVHRSFGLITVLGFFPPEAGFKAAEVQPGEGLPPGLMALYSSDAHQLGAIAEREHSLPVLPRSADAVIAFLREGIP